MRPRSRRVAAAGRDAPRSRPARSSDSPSANEPMNTAAIAVLLNPRRNVHALSRDAAPRCAVCCRPVQRMACRVRRAAGEGPANNPIAMFAAFERLVQPYPDAEPAPLPSGFLPFVWACTRGCAATSRDDRADRVDRRVRGAAVQHARPRGRLARRRSSRRSCGREQQAHLLLLGGILLASPLADRAADACIKHQTLAGNFPMRLRWNFHRLMLGQSMSFYQDEFAGRIATKVMQTALAVRDVVDDPGRHPGVRRDLFRHDGRGGRQLRRLAAGAVRAAGCCCTSSRCATSCRAWPRSPRRRPTRAR